MSETPEDLNYDCNYNMFLAKTMLDNLQSLDDRQKTVRWMKKLATSNRTLDEMKLRNDFMYYLVLNVQAGELKAPFNENPPPGALQELADILPRNTSTAEAAAQDKGMSASNKPLIYQNSPDGGAFLAAQPIPRCGAFCYLAVVSRVPKDE